MKKNFQKTVQPPKHTFEIGYFFRALALCALLTYYSTKGLTYAHAKYGHVFENDFLLLPFQVCTFYNSVDY